MMLHASFGNSLFTEIPTSLFFACRRLLWRALGCGLSSTRCAHRPPPLNKRDLLPSKALYLHHLYMFSTQIPRPHNHKFTSLNLQNATPLAKVRNVHPSFHWGLFAGLLYSGLTLKIFKGMEPWTFSFASKGDHTQTVGGPPSPKLGHKATLSAAEFQALSTLHLIWTQLSAAEFQPSPPST